MNTDKLISVCYFTVFTPKIYRFVTIGDTIEKRLEVGTVGTVGTVHKVDTDCLEIVRSRVYDRLVEG